MQESARVVKINSTCMKLSTLYKLVFVKLVMISVSNASVGRIKNVIRA